MWYTPPVWPWNRTPRACAECETLRAEVKRLRADIEDIGDKVFHWMKRHSARAARDVAPETAATDGARAAPEDYGPVSPRIAALLRRKHAHVGNGDP